MPESQFQGSRDQGTRWWCSCLTPYLCSIHVVGPAHQRRKSGSCPRHRSPRVFKPSAGHGGSGRRRGARLATNTLGRLCASPHRASRTLSCRTIWAAMCGNAGGNASKSVNNAAAQRVLRPTRPHASCPRQGQRVGFFGFCPLPAAVPRADPVAGGRAAGPCAARFGEGEIGGSVPDVLACRSPGPNRRRANDSTHWRGAAAFPNGA